MTRKHFSKLAQILFFITFLVNSSVAYAASCTTLGDTDPTIVDLVCIVARVINVGILFVGLMLIIMIAYGGYKLAMSYGDPKGLKGAQETWFYAFLGAGVILLAFSIVSIIGKVYGVNTGIFSGPAAVMSEFENALHYIMQAAGVGN